MDNSRTFTVVVCGAVTGAAFAFLFFTDRGRRLRRQIEPALDDFSHELSSLRSTAQKAASVATEGWQLLTDAIGETETRYAAGSRQPMPRHQSSPF
jgi:uncharacterized membrane protein YccC